MSASLEEATETKAAQKILDLLARGETKSAIQEGEALIRQMYFSEAIRHALASAYEADGRKVQAQRLFPTPQKPKSPKRLKVIRQGNADLLDRISRKHPRAAIFKAITEHGENQSFHLSTPENFNDQSSEIQATPAFKARDTLIELGKSRVVAYPKPYFSGNGAFATDAFEYLDTNRVGHSNLNGILFSPKLSWYIDEAVEPLSLGEPLFIFQRHPMLNYYHLLVEQACTILDWQEKFSHLGVRLLELQTRYSHLYKQIYELLGVDEDQVFQVNSAFVSAPHLLKPDAAKQAYPGSNSFVSASSINFFDKLSTKYNSSTCDTPKRIYISRKDSPKRGLVNAEALYAILKEYGFVEVVLTGMELKDQIELFANAEAVVGSHGAGLTNIGFCREGTFVLEITNNFTVERIRIFWELACSRKLKFNFLCAENAVKDHTVPFSAPLESVVECLEKYL